MSRTRYFLGAAAVVGAGLYVYNQQEVEYRQAPISHVFDQTVNQIKQAIPPIQVDQIQGDINQAVSDGKAWLTDKTKGASNEAVDIVQDKDILQATDIPVPPKVNEDNGILHRIGAFYIDMVNSLAGKKEQSMALLADGATGMFNKKSEKSKDAALESYEDAKSILQKAEAEAAKYKQSWGQWLTSQKSESHKNAENRLKEAKSSYDDAVNSLSDFGKGVIDATNEQLAKSKSLALSKFYKASDNYAVATKELENYKKESSDWSQDKKDQVKSEIDEKIAQAKKTYDQTTNDLYKYGSSVVSDAQKNIDQASKEISKLKDKAGKAVDDTYQQSRSIALANYYQAEYDLSYALDNIEEQRKSWGSWGLSKREEAQSAARAKIEESKKVYEQASNELSSYGSDVLANAQQSIMIAGRNIADLSGQYLDSLNKNYQYAKDAITQNTEKSKNIALSNYYQAQDNLDKAQGELEKQGKSWKIWGSSKKDQTRELAEKHLEEAKQAVDQASTDLSAFGADFLEKTKKDIEDAKNGAYKAGSKIAGKANQHLEETRNLALAKYYKAQDDFSKAGEEFEKTRSSWASWGSSKKNEASEAAQEKYDKAKLAVDQSSEDLRKFGSDLLESARLNIENVANVASKSMQDTQSAAVSKYYEAQEELSRVSKDIEDSKNEWSKWGSSKSEEASKLSQQKYDEAKQKVQESANELSKFGTGILEKANKDFESAGNKLYQVGSDIVDSVYDNSQAGKDAAIESYYRAQEEISKAGAELDKQKKSWVEWGSSKGNEANDAAQKKYDEAVKNLESSYSDLSKFGEDVIESANAQFEKAGNHIYNLGASLAGSAQTGIKETKNGALSKYYRAQDNLESASIELEKQKKAWSEWGSSKTNDAVKQAQENYDYAQKVAEDSSQSLANFGSDVLAQAKDNIESAKSNIVSMGENIADSASANIKETRNIALAKYYEAQDSLSSASEELEKQRKAWAEWGSSKTNEASDAAQKNYEEALKSVEKSSKDLSQYGADVLEAAKKNVQKAAENVASVGSDVYSGAVEGVNQAGKKVSEFGAAIVDSVSGGVDRAKNIATANYYKAQDELEKAQKDLEKSKSSWASWGSSKGSDAQVSSQKKYDEAKANFDQATSDLSKYGDELVKSASQTVQDLKKQGAEYYNQFIVEADKVKSGWLQAVGLEEEKKALLGSETLEKLAQQARELVWGK